ncbi:SDR family NAD(P)-dependent oxidoreductase [Corynebacterium terpenotabidum]|uniref:Short chain dehydrogenase n=1 Tax=Corynebacterium terpenotabidum Y-11 TaxID=1200352 RepID=S4XBZ6_9CORY|nr:SDR family oxidoreductase [Corynebacterium terpenotabidum]AGP30647.1 short chain dehydrogenase [Corynebacterium terpenotabidum Y-11]
MNLHGKTVIVTGGGAGIGREVVRQLLDHGATVHALDLNTDALATDPATADGRLFPHQVNIADRDAVAALAVGDSPDIGPVDALVNVAGIVQDFVDINDLDRSTMERVINVNFWGTVNTVTTFLPGMLTRPEAAVVNVSSMGALVPVPGQSAYGASKAAVKLFTEGLRAELRKTKVSVSVVFPGGVDTDITTNSGVEVAGADDPEARAKASKFLTAPQDAAAKIVRAIETGKPRVIIGKDARVMDLLSRIMPVAAASAMAALMAKLTG